MPGFLVTTPSVGQPVIFLLLLIVMTCGLPNKLESQLHEMNDSVFSCTPYYILNQKQNAKCSNIIDLNKSGFYFYDDLLKKKLTLGCSTVLLCRKTFYDFKMCEIRAGQDYASWLCLLRRGHSVKTSF